MSLSIELIEWKQLVTGVPYKLVPTLEVLPSGSASQPEDQAPAAKDGGKPGHDKGALLERPGV
jgi:hypothetical protein